MSDGADDVVEGFSLVAASATGGNGMTTLEPMFQRVNDQFAIYLRAVLLQHLRRAVTVTSVGVELVAHRELMAGLSSPIHLTLFNMKPLRGTLALMVETALVVAIVESRFGGDGRFPINLADRQFTPFELRSMRPVVGAALERLAAAWEPLGRFEAETVRYETSPQFAGFAAADDLVAVSTFEVAIDHGKGKLAVYLPYAGVERLQDEAAFGIQPDTMDHDLRWTTALRANVAQAPITLNVELGKIEISVGDLVALRAGNVFEMDRPDSLVVEASGVALFRGRWGRHGSRIGVLVEERLSPATGERVGQLGEGSGVADGR